MSLRGINILTQSAPTGEELQTRSNVKIMYVCMYVCKLRKRRRHYTTPSPEDYRPMTGVPPNETFLKRSVQKHINLNQDQARTRINRTSCATPGVGARAHIGHDKKRYSQKG